MGDVVANGTSFLRDGEQLDAIDWHALAESSAVAGSATIRVWCTGCATGEEAYSLALLAAEAFAPADPLVQILATDTSNAALAAAGRGRYRDGAVRALDERLRTSYFTRAGEALVVAERLRRAVRFMAHDLASDPIPPPRHGPFDLIVCRNLPDLDEPTAERVLAALRSALAPGGMLVLGTGGDASERTSPAERIRRRRALALAALGRRAVSFGP
jgi:two-component system, chemotaxis family, CheB/CheR fusion protein